MKREYIVLLSSLLVIFLSFVFLKEWDFVEVDPELNTATGDIFIKYLFIVIAAERAVTVVITVMYGREVDLLESTAKALRGKLAKYKKTEDKNTHVDKDPTFLSRKDSDGEEAEVIYINLIEGAEKKLTSLKEKREQTAMYILLFIGILLAIGGLSILNDLVIKPDTWMDDGYQFQRGLFRLMDLVITGLLIGGGSKSFHQLISTTDKLLERAKTGNEA